MNYRTLGRTGIRVSPDALGTMMLGAMGNTDHDESVRIIHRALDAGINFIDTADVYGAGESEQIVGKALAGGRRDDVVLATKFHNPMGEDPNQRGNSRRWIMRAVEDSLRRLGTDWVDLYRVSAATSARSSSAAGPRPAGTWRWSSPSGVPIRYRSILVRLLVESPSASVELDTSSSRVRASV